MSTPVVFNGVTYSIPAYGDTGYAQGSGNLSAYLIALAGGPFPFTSQTSNPATAGTIRLAHSDTIDWRNQANSGNLPLGVNVSDQLTFNGSILATSPVTVPNGGTGNTSFTAYSIIAAGITATGAFQNVSGLGTSGQVLTSNGAGALPTWQNSGSGSQIIPQVIQSSNGTQYNITNNVFTAVGPTATISLQSATYKVKITVQSTTTVDAAGNVLAYTIFKDGVNLFAPGGAGNVISDGGGDVVPVSFSWVETPGDTAAHTYQAYIYSNTLGSRVVWGYAAAATVLNTVLLEEILV